MQSLVVILCSILMLLFSYIFGYVDWAEICELVIVNVLQNENVERYRDNILGVMKQIPGPE